MAPVTLDLSCGVRTCEANRRMFPSAQNFSIHFPFHRLLETNTLKGRKGIDRDAGRQQDGSYWQMTARSHVSRARLRPTSTSTSATINRCHRNKNKDTAICHRENGRHAKQRSMMCAAVERAVSSLPLTLLRPRDDSDVICHNWRKKPGVVITAVQSESQAEEMLAPLYGTFPNNKWNLMALQATTPMPILMSDKNMQPVRSCEVGATVPPPGLWNCKTFQTHGLFFNFNFLWGIERPSLQILQETLFTCGVVESPASKPGFLASINGTCVDYPKGFLNFQKKSEIIP